MTLFFSSTIKVDCPDGPRYILKHPEKAFAIAFPEWDVRINALIKFYSGSEARVDAKILKETKSIVNNLTENYAALQAHYQAAYLGWWGNPCSKEAERAYNDAKAVICKKEFALRELENTTLKLVNKIEAKQEIPREKKGRIAKREKRAGPPFARERIPVPETVFQNIEELVSKLKI